MDNTNNKAYWNNYVTYWENRVKETNEGKEKMDPTSDDVILETYYNKLKVEKGDFFLDYGCGSGRLFTIYSKEFGIDNNYFGIDVSGICLEHAQKISRGLEIGKNLKEFDGIHIPFDDDFFDKIICFGVFDVCNQEKVIRELFRVLKVGGVLLITGKNNLYFEDDVAASMAEINARKKEHPNYFTDVHNFTIQLQHHNVKLLETYYFLRRGDFPRNQAVIGGILPDIFYEWAYLMEKTEKYKDSGYKKFSDKYSSVNGDKNGK
ncbi:MAG: class I SAM-dependent methyltransferase [Lachnospiraceae bacterium]|nr:class I SAM-dependent methyltransferase [Lachnospiraceae bacterium]